MKSNVRDIFGHSDEDLLAQFASAWAVRGFPVYQRILFPADAYPDFRQVDVWLSGVSAK